jgi:hypothetical protein
VAVDAAGNVYVADRLNNAIRKIAPSGTNWIVTTIAGGTAGAGDGTNTDAQFFSPTGIAVDSGTNLYVADQFNYTIRKLVPAGTNWVVSTIAGRSRSSGTNDGVNTNAQFFNPTGLAVDNAGNIFVADEFNNAIRKITPSGTNWIVSTIAGGTNGSADGTNSAAGFYDPAGVAVDTNGRVFVADQFNNTIRLLTPSGTNWVVTTIAGELSAGANNGTGTNAQFNAPVGIALDPNNNVYVVDSFNSAVREMTPLGSNWMVSTVGGGSSGTSNGTGANAQFYLPFGIAADAYGHVYVADSGNNAIRLGVPSSSAYVPNYTITPNASPPAGGSVSGGGVFPMGSTNTVTATANGGYVFTNWTQGGIVTSTSPNFTFTVASNMTLIANFLPTRTLSVTASPANEGTAGAGGTIFVQGTSQAVTAVPGAGFEFIGWAGQASGTNNPLIVTMTTDLRVAAYFAPIGSMTLTVITNGNGTVSPNLNNKILKKGRSYSLLASARPGNLFSNWTGSITAKGGFITVKMISSMVLQANFVTNPFLPVKGVYNGLFSATNGVTEQTAGMVRGLTIGQYGAYSGTLLNNGGRYFISGAFDLTGYASNRVFRPASRGGPLVTEMTLDWSNSPPQVRGSVAGTNWSADLIADRASSGASSVKYTMLIPPDINNAPPALSPGGDGYASIMQHASTTSVVGALADGTSFSETVAVSQDGYIPIYANLYASKGLFFGWINLNPTNQAGVGLAWIHPQRLSGLYTNGFTNIVVTNQILISPWTNSPGNIESLTNLILSDTMMGSNSSITVTITGLGKVTGASVNGFINPKTGLMKVTIGSGASRLTGLGAILINKTNGGGYFLTATNAEAIQLAP